MTISLHDINGQRSNQIINNLDSLLAQGNSIDDLVQELDDVRIVANYELLSAKGAHIDLSAIRDRVDPVVVINNIRIFKNASVPVSLEKFSDDPQALVDSYDGTDPIVLQAILDAGLRVKVDKVVDRLLYDEDYLQMGFSVEENIPVLMRAGANSDDIYKILKRVYGFDNNDEQVKYHEDGSYPEQPNVWYINETGKQTKKIFFVPQISVMSPSGWEDLQVDWAGRVLPGQTLLEGIATELKETLGYSGRFDFVVDDFLDYVKDNKGDDIQRYRINIKLYPTDEDKISV